MGYKGCPGYQGIVVLSLPFVFFCQFYLKGKRSTWRLIVSRKTLRYIEMLSSDMTDYWDRCDGDELQIAIGLHIDAYRTLRRVFGLPVYLSAKRYGQLVALRLDDKVPPEYMTIFRLSPIARFRLWLVSKLEKES